MTKTNNPCFISNNEMMIWQENNCLQCKKAVWYNQRLKKMPQYRCAIQRQIEEQAMMGNIEITERTYEATRTGVCSMFKAKKEEQEQAEEILDFSKGESMVADLPSVEEQASTTDEAPAVEVEVAEEQPKEMSKVETESDAVLMKISMETGMNYDALKDAERRMYEAIESGERLSPIMNEMKFKKEVKGDVEKMLKTFTWKENMMIAFVPLVISNLAWIYTEKVLRYCADHRIPQTVKLGRAAKHVREEYNNVLRKDLDAKHIERIYKQTEKFQQTYAHDFAILWFCIDAAILAKYPNVRYREMIDDAYVALMMCRFLVEHNKRMDKIISAKMGGSQSIQDPNMVKLRTILEAYCGDCVIENPPNIDACMRILQKNINAIEFEVDDAGEANRGR